MNDDELTTTYLRHHETKNKDDQWAWKEVDELVHADAERGLEIVRILISKAASDKALAYVAAGPLEDLLNKHGLALIDRIDEESRRSDRWRLALSGAWILPDVPVFERWYELMRKYGFADGKREAL